MFGHGGVLQKSLVPLPSPSRRHTRRQQHIPTPENGHQYVKTESRHNAARVHRLEVRETELGEKLVIKYPETSGGPLQVSACGKSDRPEYSAVLTIAV